MIEKQAKMSRLNQALTREADQPPVHQTRRAVVRSLSASALGAMGAMGAMGAGLLPQPANAQTAATFPTKRA